MSKEQKIMNEHNDLDFSVLLASSIHDMKNSLAMLLGSITEVSYQCMPSGCKSQHELTKIQHQGQRVNSQLIQLLILYRVKRDEYCLNITEQYLRDFLEEILLENQELLELNGLEIDIECDESISGYFDADLVKGVINTILTNAQQYTNKKIMLCGDQADGYTVLSVMDDGAGYPEKMIAVSSDTDTSKSSVSFTSGSTGLGLYFSKIVAGLHHNADREGYFELSNDGINGGGKFTLFLP